MKLKLTKKKNMSSEESKGSYMGSFHALNLCCVLHSLGEAEGRVGDWSPVGLKHIRWEGKKNNSADVILQQM